MVPKAKVTKEKEEKVNYIEARGSRKTSVARVRLLPSKKGIEVNDKDYKTYFSLVREQEAVTAPFKATSQEGSYGVSVRVVGGGPTGQAEAIRLGVSRALVKANPDLKIRLRQAGFLTRDSRMVERKKYGLKKARRAPQWAKR